MDAFSTLLGKNQSAEQQQLDSFKSEFAARGGRFVDSGVVKGAVSMESMGQSDSMTLRTALEDLKHAVKRVTSGEKLTPAQESSAVVAGVIASNPAAHFRAPVTTIGQLQSRSDEYTNVVGSLGVESIGRLSQLATEAYDNRDNESIAAYSLKYNLAAAKQDAMSEMFFPTITMMPGQFAFETSTTLRLLQNDARHALNGAALDLNRRNIIKGFVDPTLLANESLRLYPVVRTGGANDTTGYFVASTDVAPHTVVTYDGNNATTAPLVVGKEFNLLALGQTDAAIANGQFDSTDAIDSALRLERIYIKLGSAGGNAVLAMDTSYLPGSNFNQAVQGNTRKMQLSFETASLKVLSSTTDVAGAAVTELAAIGTNSVRLKVSLVGSVVQDTGAGSVQAMPVTVASVHSAQQDVLSLTTGAGATIAALFVGATVIGVDLYANRTNSNIRTRGQQINTQKYRSLYAVPYLSPIHAIRPIGETDANDADALETLISATNVRTTNDAVTALLKHAQAVKAFYSANDSILQQPEGFGVARYITNVAYATDTLDVATSIDSLTTADRIADLQALLVNKIRVMATKLYIESGYGPALQATKGSGRKAKVIVGCDPNLHQYLMVTGDNRTLSEMFDLEIQHSYDQRMRGRIVISFGTEEGAKGEFDPLHFGVMAWRPELTVALPMTRNGQISHELIVQPSYLHVPNLQAVGELFVENLDAVTATKVTVNVSQ